MLTGSLALGYYGKPRMTRDLDFVVALIVQQVEKLVSAFSQDFHIEDAARSADWPYLREWAAKLGVADMLEDGSK